MKKILKPAEQEEVLYYSDFSGKPLGEYPAITITLDFGYGSIYDGSNLTLNLNDDEVDTLLEFLASRLTEESKKALATPTNSLILLDKLS